MKITALVPRAGHIQKVPCFKLTTSCNAVDDSRRTTKVIVPELSASRHALTLIINFKMLLSA